MAELAGRPIVFQSSDSRGPILSDHILTRYDHSAAFLLFCFPTTIGISILSQSRHLTLMRSGVNQPARQERDQSTTAAHKRSADISFVLFPRHTGLTFLTSSWQRTGSCRPCRHPSMGRPRVPVFHRWLSRSSCLEDGPTWSVRTQALISRVLQLQLQLLPKIISLLFSGPITAPHFDRGRQTEHWVKEDSPPNWMGLACLGFISGR